MVELSTKNLRLRSLSLSDAKELYKLRFNEQVTKFIDRKKPKEENEILDFIKDRIKDVEQDKIMFWAICRIDYPRLIGTICLWNFNETRTTAEIGYELHPDFHGKGFMSETLKAVLNFGFNEINLRSIEAFTHKNNEPSKSLLNKLRFKLEPHRKDEGFPNNLIYTKYNA